MVTVVVGSAKKAVRNLKRSVRSMLRASLERQAVQLAGAAGVAGTGLSVAEDDGFARFDAGALPGTGDTLERARRAAQAWKLDPERPVGGMPKNLLRTTDLDDHPGLLRLMLHDDILAATTAYLGQAPRLLSLKVWWTPPNQRARGSQLFHYDHRDSRQMKLFVHLDAVDAERGPLHFLSAADSQRVDAQLGYKQGRYSDERVFRAVPRERLIAATGPQGTGWLLDTARCLHFGSRGNRDDRLILMASFARVNCVDPGPGCQVLDPVRETLAESLFPGDALRRFVLTAAR